MKKTNKHKNTIKEVQKSQEIKNINMLTVNRQMKAIYSMQIL